MIQTDKYKKGIIALTKRVSEFNSLLGEYQCHYITAQARFVIHLTTGKLEIDIELAKEFEKDPNTLTESQLKRIAISYKGNYKTTVGVDTAWKRLFIEDKGAPSF